MVIGIIDVKANKDGAYDLNRVLGVERDFKNT
jgi:hypothetical protein